METKQLERRSSRGKKMLLCSLAILSRISHLEHTIITPRSIIIASQREHDIPHHALGAYHPLHDPWSGWRTSCGGVFVKKRPEAGRGALWSYRQVYGGCMTTTCRTMLRMLISNSGSSEMNHPITPVRCKIMRCSILEECHRQLLIMHAKGNSQRSGMFGRAICTCTIMNRTTKCVAFIQIQPQDKHFTKICPRHLPSRPGDQSRWCIVR